MKPLDSFFPEKIQKQYENVDDCWEAVNKGSCNDAYFIHQYRIPIQTDESFITIDLKQPIYADMISDFECNLDYSIFIGDTEYKTNSVLTLCAVLHKVEARVYLKKEDRPKEVVFSQKQHYFEYEIRRKIVNSMNPYGGILDGDIVYKYGMAGSSKESTT